MPHHLKKLTPNLIVADVSRSIAFYRDVLGFTLAQTVPDAEPFVFAIVRSGTVEIFSERARAGAGGVSGVQGPPDWRHAHAVHRRHDIRASYDELKDRVQVVMPLETKWYGPTEFAFLDPDGYIITFAQPECVRRRVVSGFSRTGHNGRVFRCLAAMIVVLAVAQAAAAPVLQSASHALGRSRPAGHVFQLQRIRHAARAAGAIRRPPHRGHHAGGDGADPSGRRAAGVDGLAPGPRGPDYWWLENLNLSKRAQPWSVVDPSDGRIPPLTPEARKRGAGPARTSFMGGPFNGPEDLGFLERCITRSIPGSMIPVMYGNNYQIVQTPGFVVITYEIIHEARVIPLDGRPHVGSGVRMHMGDARGHWEGDTLVVETTNFTKAAAYRGADPATFRVVERFKRVAPDTIQWTATMEDPATWTRPWTIAMPLVLDTQSPILPFECHEHNYGMFNILKAARAAEK